MTMTAEKKMEWQHMDCAGGFASWAAERVWNARPDDDGVVHQLDTPGFVFGCQHLHRFDGRVFDQT